ncbi:MAG: transcription-repair coupling factor [Clostridia bacterium]|nr:transcription-repair coupling factor [Clostridia bacterium]
MNYMINPLLEIEEYKEVLDSIKKYTRPLNINGPSDSQKIHLAYSICRHSGCKGVYIAFNEMQARKMYEDLMFFLGDEVVFFPAKEIMLHDIEAKSYDSVFQRIKALERIAEGRYEFIVTSAEAIAQKLTPKRIFLEGIISFKLGGKVYLEELTKKLIAIGYERVATVEGKGQFSIRGGIIDIFSVNNEHAVRIELFDDEIDSIRRFDVATQRSIDKLDTVKVVPAREVIYYEEDRDFIIENIERDLAAHIRKIRNKDNNEYIKQLGQKISGDMDTFRSDYYFPGLDRYIPYIINNPSSVIDYATDTDVNVIAFVDEPVRFEQRVENVLLEHYEACKSLMEKGQILPNSYEIYFNKDELISNLEKGRCVSLNTIPVENSKLRNSKSFSIVSKSIGSYQGHFDLLIDDVKAWKRRNNRIVVLSGPRGRGERLVETLRTKDIEAVYIDNFDGEIQNGQILVTHGSLNRGFEYPSIGLLIVSDKEVFGQDRRIKRPGSKKQGDKIKAFTDLNVGDYVVHQAHGIGQYVGIEKLVVDNIKRDYLKIRYQEGGFLYIPTNQLELIQKYIGSEGKSPKLSKLGGTEWAKAKSRVKESLRELAEELVKLYAQRQALKGFAFSGDTVWQNQMEELFPYEETEDQLKCIEEIKKDMQSERPMDRLLCGDVGYGKTEVAIRAVFKAVMDGKQVAYLVPTTVLAQQQFNSFKERMKDFPVTIEVMSRFRTAAEQKSILKDVKNGNIDILIGTHRLLQKDVQFRDLGLLVVDEEQRFGVTHKEKLKNIKPNVDVLTLTATPIPRTLHMSLVGIRDISVIEDPPEERYPVQTYVMEHNPEVIRDSIIREMSRNGQVFYLYNRVRTIELKALELQNLVPDARIAVAHGQMAEGQLEDIMFKFISGEYDILVCTTIIESGLDMPNVNTIIVEDADKMGLSQLYQIRGRVGRSNRLAYAYITYKKDKILAEIAEKRLQAIKEFTEFGSGFKIAMRDLEIRGAGNLLGPEQHGHMESVGYDMYCKLLDESVRELKGESLTQDDGEISIDVNISAYIDDEYIGTETQKIEMYKRIAAIQDEQDVIDVEDELTDRYGDLPGPVRNLLQVAYLKTLAKECGFTSVQEKNDSIIFQYKSSNNVNLDVLGKLMDKYKRKLMFTASNTPYIAYKITGIGRENLIENIKILLQDIIKLKYVK